MTRWSRSSECSRRDSVAQIAASASGPSPSASGPRWASSCSAASGVSSQTPGALLRAGLGEDELRAALELEPERRRLRAFLAGAQVLRRPGGHQVDEQNELAVVGGKQKPLRAPPRPGAGAPRARQRRVERLQRRDVRGAGPRDRERAHRLVELAAPGLHLRQLRQLRPSSMVGANQGSRARGSSRVRAPRARRRRPRREARCVSRRSAPRDVPPLLREAVPGAAARARLRRPRSARARDRLGVAPRRPRAARGRPHAARTCPRRRGRPGMRPGGAAAVAAQAQLLREARGDARGLPRARLAHRGLPPSGAPDAAHEPARRRGRCRPGRGRDPHGRRRLRRGHVRASSRGMAAMFTQLEPKGSASPTRCGPTPS